MPITRGRPVLAGGPVPRGPALQSRGRRHRREASPAGASPFWRRHRRGRHVWRRHGAGVGGSSGAEDYEGRAVPSRRRRGRSGAAGRRLRTGRAADAQRTPCASGRGGGVQSPRGRRRNRGASAPHRVGRFCQLLQLQAESSVTARPGCAQRGPVPTTPRPRESGPAPALRPGEQSRTTSSHHPGAGRHSAGQPATVGDGGEPTDSPPDPAYPAVRPPDRGHRDGPFSIPVLATRRQHRRAVAPAADAPPVTSPRRRRSPWPPSRMVPRTSFRSGQFPSILVSRSTPRGAPGGQSVERRGVPDPPVRASGAPLRPLFGEFMPAGCYPHIPPTPFDRGRRRPLLPCPSPPVATAEDRHPAAGAPSSAAVRRHGGARYRRR